MNITERVVSKKRHTIGFVISGKEYTRNQALKLAREGKLSGIEVATNQHGAHLVGKNMSLLSLPERISKSPKFSSLLSK